SYEFEDSSTGSASARTMLKQLETDFKAGILSEEDYHAQQDSLQGMSIGALDVKTEGASGLDDEIEKRVAGLRSGGKPAEEDEIEEKIRQLRRTSTAAGSHPAATGDIRQAKARYCSQCGAKVQPGSRFCTRCGEQLT
ncbi:MAG: zinc-ribbon domain-containing protein, partial [Dehalococcoidales bacterium]|nr:zinc-ribbon domain-containing protein [Dehalococcoidales bacterium]